MLQHIALEVADPEKGARFFTEILGLTKQKSSTLPAALNRALFGFSEDTAMETWSDGALTVEVFITGTPVSPSYSHVCLGVPDIAAFLEKCAAHGVPIITAPKGDKEIVFIKDFSGNLYEITEQQ